ncbi:putative diguanylate cyclase YegE [Roseibium album]|nr:putative diguanylate cyclase YegE [Roseibium album]
MKKSVNLELTDSFPCGNDSAYLRKILDGAAICMVITTLDGQLLFANAAANKIFQFSNGSSVVSRLDDILASEENGLSRVLSDLKSGALDSYRGEHLCYNRSGRKVWISLAVSVLRPDEEQRAAQLVVQFIEIDELKRAESALQRSESRWSFALNAARQGVWDHDGTSDEMFYSPMWRELRGLGPDEPVDDCQEAWLSRLHQDDHDRIRQVINKQNRGENGFDTIEYRERHRDGHYVWILSRGQPIEWDADGNVTRTIGTDTDITRLKNVEAQLAAEEERWRITLGAISDATVTVDAEGLVTYLNDAAQQWTGWVSADALGRPAAEILDLQAPKMPLIKTLVEACLAQGTQQVAGNDAVLWSRTGERREVRCSVSAIDIPERGRMGAVVVLHDVADSRKLQRQLAHAANHDSLTGLANRTKLERVLEEAIQSAAPHYLLFIDLDRFKPVNDTLGHAAGDRLLCRIAGLIRDVAPSGACCARCGGDEFVVLVPDTPTRPASSISKAIVDGVASLDVEGSAIKVGASVGLTQLGTGDTPADALARADAACYRAKKAGRGQVQQDTCPVERETFGTR